MIRTQKHIDSEERMRKFAAGILKAAKIRGLTIMEYLAVLSNLQSNEIETCRMEELK